MFKVHVYWGDICKFAIEIHKRCNIFKVSEVMKSKMGRSLRYVSIEMIQKITSKEGYTRYIHWELYNNNRILNSKPLNIYNETY